MWVSPSLATTHPPPLSKTHLHVSSTPVSESYPLISHTWVMCCRPQRCLPGGAEGGVWNPVTLAKGKEATCLVTLVLPLVLFGKGHQLNQKQLECNFFNRVQFRWNLAELLTLFDKYSKRLWYLLQVISKGSFLVKRTRAPHLTMPDFDETCYA